MKDPIESIRKFISKFKKEIKQKSFCEGRTIEIDGEQYYLGNYEINNRGKQVILKFNFSRIGLIGPSSNEISDITITTVTDREWP